MGEEREATTLSETWRNAGEAVVVLVGRVAGEDEEGRVSVAIPGAGADVLVPGTAVCRPAAAEDEGWHTFKRFELAVGAVAALTPEDLDALTEQEFRKLLETVRRTVARMEEEIGRRDETNVG
jgi:hypothetical protein